MSLGPKPKPSGPPPTDAPVSLMTYSQMMDPKKDGQYRGQVARWIKQGRTVWCYIPATKIRLDKERRLTAMSDYEIAVLVRELREKKSWPIADHVLISRPAGEIPGYREPQLVGNRFVPAIRVGQFDGTMIPPMRPGDGRGW